MHQEMENLYSTIAEYGGRELRDISRSFREKAEETDKAIERRIYSKYPTVSNIGFALRKAIRKGDIENIEYMVRIYSKPIPVTWNMLVSMIITSSDKYPKDPRIARTLLEKSRLFSPRYKTYLETLVAIGKKNQEISTYKIDDLYDLGKIGKLDILLSVPRDMKEKVGKLIKEWSNHIGASVYAINRQIIEKYIAYSKYSILWLIQNGYIYSEEAPNAFKLILSIVNDNVLAFISSDGVSWLDDGKENAVEFLLMFDAVSIFNKYVPIHLYFNKYASSRTDISHPLRGLYPYGKILKEVAQRKTIYIYSTNENTLWSDAVEVLNTVLSPDIKVPNRDYYLIEAVKGMYLEIIDKYMTRDNALQLVVYAYHRDNAHIIPKALYRILDAKGYDIHGLAYILGDKIISKTPPRDLTLWKKLLANAIVYETKMGVYRILTSYLISKYKSQITDEMIEKIFSLLLNVHKEKYKGSSIPVHSTLANDRDIFIEYGLPKERAMRIYESIK